MPRSRDDDDYEDFLEWKRERSERARPTRRRSRDDDEPPARRRAGARSADDDAVIVLSGEHAKSFLTSMFGSPDEPDDDDDQGDEPEDDEPEDDEPHESEPVADPAPGREGHPFFRGRRG